jgi:hypothetical protein
VFTTYYVDEIKGGPLKDTLDWGNETLFKWLTADSVCWIAGGALRSKFSGQKPADIDLYFPNVGELNKAGNVLYQHGYSPTFENDNTKTITDGKTTFDLVKRYYSSLEQTIASFDFTVSACGIDKDSITYHDDYFIDLATKRLNLTGEMVNPAGTLLRMQKYIKYGFTMDVEDMRVLAARIADVDVNLIPAPVMVPAVATTYPGQDPVAAKPTSQPTPSQPSQNESLFTKIKAQLGGLGY